MAALSPEKLETYLTEYGWKFRRTAAGEWQTGWAEGGRFFSLMLKLEDHWITFTVTPLVHVALDWYKAADLSKHLLELNDRVQMVRIGLDDAGSVVLVSQALTSGFAYDELTQILGIMGYYADSLSKEITEKVYELGFPSQSAQTLLT